MRRLALTTWSLHRLLTAPTPPLRLVDVPARMRDAGIGTLEICHFHFPDTGATTLRELRAAFNAAGAELFSILIDMGDISDADQHARAQDIRAIEAWIDVAAQLGATAVRIVAGEAAPDDEAALERSISALRHLAAYAHEQHVRVLTENFKPLASTARNCLLILDALDGAAGLCADMGNFPAHNRVAEFISIVPRAQSVHVKASYDAGGRPDTSELRRCLEATRTAGFDGPYTLVYDRPSDPWQGLAELREIVAPYARPY